MTILAIVMALGPSALLMWFFHSRDVYPEPAGVVWRTFSLGIVITVPVVITAKLVEPTVLTMAGGNGHLLGWLNAFLLAAMPEEFFKYQVLTRYSLRHSACDEPMDGMVYGVAASLGFATLENVLYVSDGGLSVALMRAFSAVPGHAMLGAIMGFYAGQAVFRPEAARSLKRQALWWPILLHGLYDAPLMSMRDAHGETSGMIRITLLIVWLLVLLTEVVWALRLAEKLRIEQLTSSAKAAWSRGILGWTKLVLGGMLWLLVSGLFLILGKDVVVEGRFTDNWLSIVSITLCFLMIPGSLGWFLLRSGIRSGRPEADLSPSPQRGFWGWFKMIFGVLLMTLGGLILLVLIQASIQMSEEKRNWAIQALVMAILAGVPGFVGWISFRSGLSGKSNRT